MKDIKDIVATDGEIRGMLRNAALNELLKENQYNKEMSVAELWKTVDNLLDSVHPDDQKKLVGSIIKAFGSRNISIIGELNIISNSKPTTDLEKVSDPKYDLRNCPECGERATMTSKCNNLDCICPNKHEWHSCFIHHVKVLGRSEDGPLDEFCTCGRVTAEKAQKREGMLSTGLVDKNGKGIRVGDFLSKEGDEKREIFFEDGCFGFRGALGNCVHLRQYDASEWEIVSIGER